MFPGSALAHLYLGEIHRMSRWREGLDRTTNWAVTVLAANLTWAFSDPEKPHFRILRGAVAVGFFLGIEAHRFRGSIVCRTRVRLLQEHVWAQGLDPEAEPSTVTGVRSWPGTPATPRSRSPMRRRWPTGCTASTSRSSPSCCSPGASGRPPSARPPPRERGHRGAAGLAGPGRGGGVLPPRRSHHVPAADQEGPPGAPVRRDREVAGGVIGARRTLSPPRPSVPVERPPPRTPARRPPAGRRCPRPRRRRGPTSR